MVYGHEMKGGGVSGTEVLDLCGGNAYNFWVQEILKFLFASTITRDGIAAAIHEED